MNERTGTHETDIGDYERLTALLADPSVARRREAASVLQYLGERSVEPLCTALEDSDAEVRLIAAESLRDLADPRALKPLLEALRGTFPWKRRNFQFLRSIGIIVGLPLIITSVVALATAGIMSLSGEELDIKSVVKPFMILQACQYSWYVIRGLRDKNRTCSAIANALVAIAERSPSPLLRAAMPDLEAISRDIVSQHPEIRAAAQRVQERIAELTDDLKNLPAPASSDSTDSTNLPRVADESMGAVQDLPARVTDFPHT